MTDDMRTFRIEIELENPARAGERHRFANVLVDAGPAPAATVA